MYGHKISVSQMHNEGHATTYLGRHVTLTVGNILVLNFEGHYAFCFSISTRGKRWRANDLFSFFRSKVI